LARGIEGEHEARFPTLLALDETGAPVNRVVLAACTARSSTKGKITSADAQPDAVPDIVGSYSVNGEDPIGTEYGGNLTIKPGASPTEYLLQWIVTGSIQEGSGRLDGNKLRVEWRTVEESSHPAG